MAVPIILTDSLTLVVATATLAGCDDVFLIAFWTMDRSMVGESDEGSDGNEVGDGVVMLLLAMELIRG